MRGSRWRNWARNQECRPARIDHPTSEDELARIVREATGAGQRVKVAGAGHSFTAIALTDGRLICLDRYQRVLSLDPSTERVTVQAGIRLGKLNGELHARRLALPNLGDVDRQSVSGAISTATHGTGMKLPGLAGTVVGMRLIRGDGSILECSAERETEVFRAARVGLCALGIVSTVTLQCVASFNLRAVEAAVRVGELLENLEQHVDGNDHFEFFWVPHTDWALTKWNNRTEDPERPRGPWKSLRDDILLSNAAFGALCRIGRLRPSLIPRLSRLIPGGRRVEYVGRSDRVFVSPRLVKFYEMEYAIPVVHAAEALNRIRSFVERRGLRISFPVEMRFAAADDIPLSTAFGRATCYIAVHVYRGTPYRQYFEGVEEIMNDYGGRPHWGKLHFQNAESLEPRYPEWGRFQAVRARLDPEGRFRNAYLDRVLGPL